MATKAPVQYDGLNVKSGCGRSAHFGIPARSSMNPQVRFRDRLN
ncbi:MAG TPA: hypothetical protein VGV89_06225 [Thermoplasmata archaeon]|nr:hypothetical protein [Thermoplasmata archaeon]